MMEGVKNKELLSDHRVKEEIERHRWLESEKVHGDIGFDQAARDWLNRFSDAWKKANLPKAKLFGKSTKRF